MTGTDTIPGNLYYGGFDLGAPELPDARMVSICLEWIGKYCRPRKTINNAHGSYGLKHVVETWATSRRATGTEYISNGSLIAAFIRAGYRCVREGDGPNAVFNFQYIGPKVGERGCTKRMPYAAKEWAAVEDQ